MKDNAFIFLIIIILLKPGWLILSSEPFQFDQVPAVVEQLTEDDDISLLPINSVSPLGHEGKEVDNFETRSSGNEAGRA